MLRRATVRTASAIALAGMAVALVSTPVHAAAYRYWTYWQAPAGAAGWSFATEGPGTAVPQDGDVEGWSFGVTTESGNLDDAPATAPDFAEICGGTAPIDGMKRVALVVDPGSAALAPDAETPPPPVATCARVADDATGYAILRSAADVRIENGLICGIAGYPTNECAPVLDDAEAQALLAAAAALPSDPPASPVGTATAEPTDMDAEAAGAESTTAGDSGTPLMTLAVGLLLAAGVAFWYLRGRRDQ